MRRDFFFQIHQKPFSIFRDLSFGRGTTAALKGASLPQVHNVEPWDGKDGELPPEEDIDLSDINLDEGHQEL